MNTVNDLAAGGITEVTPDLGETPGLSKAATLVLGRVVDGGFVVDDVRTGVTTVAAAHGRPAGLLGAGDGGQWLTDTLHTGDTVGIATRCHPMPMSRS